MNWWDRPMVDLAPWWVWLVGALVFCGAVYAWMARPRCLHHWHPADPMTAWLCCWCGKNVDGSPKDRSVVCRRNFRNAPH